MQEQTGEKKEGQVPQLLLVTSPWKLSESETRQCRRLTFQREGVMAQHLLLAQEEKRGSIVLVKNRSAQQLLAWGLLLPAPPGYRRPRLNVYVRANQRRRGLGRLVVAQLLQLSKKQQPYYKPEVEIHDSASEMFYSAYRKELAFKFQYGYQRQGQQLPESVALLQVNRQEQDLKIQWKRVRRPQGERVIVSVNCKSKGKKPQYLVFRLPAQKHTLRVPGVARGTRVTVSARVMSDNGLFSAKKNVSVTV